MDYRIEKDSVGEKEIPVDAYYGVHSLRAMENFPITGLKLHKEMIIAISQIKKACAMTNYNVGLLDKVKCDAIIEACDELILGNYHEQFIVDPIQGGAGTSTNMNANEVIANIALEKLGHKKGSYHIINPNDDVNMGQSTNDVYPSCGKLATLKLIIKSIHALEELNYSLEIKANEFKDIIKMGRTQLEDAVPISLGQEFHSYSSAIKRDIKRFKKSLEEIEVLNLGGTAIGTGLNAHIDYVKEVVPTLKEIIGIDVVQAEDLIDGTQNLDCYVLISGIIKSCAVNLSKMCNDLRIMNSGPRTGIGEINLPPRQNGSSIMPGKINPVIPEVVNQIAFNIIGNDTTITLAAEGGQLELNAFEPIIFYNLFESLDTLTNGINTLNENCIKGIKANKEECIHLLEHSVGMITAVTPYIGYEKAAQIAKEALANNVSIRSLILKDKLIPEEKLDKILDPSKMISPGIIEKR